MPELKTKAVLTPKTDNRGRDLSDAQKKDRRVDVFFNPESLEVTLTNSIQKGNRRRPAQTVTESTAKLTMDLIFDTTLDGKDVSSYLYTEREVDALHRGGVHQLYRGNLKVGEHELVAVFTGTGPHDRDYRRGATLTFDKAIGAKFVELRISDQASKLQPEFVVSEWE